MAASTKIAGVAGELEAMQGVMGSGEEGQLLQRLVSKVATLEAAAGQSEAQRRSLHNQLVELRGNVGCPTCFLQTMLPAFLAIHCPCPDPLLSFL